MQTPFERLVTKLSTHFITLPLEAIDAGIDHALAELGELCEVDRVYLFRFLPEHATNTHEWCREGIEPQKELLQALPYEAFSWWHSAICDGEVIHLESLDDIPEEAAEERAILEAQSVRSVVSVPLCFEDDCLGFAGFDSVRAQKRWSDDDIALLRVVGEMLVHALVRQQAERERRTLEAELAEARKLEAIGRLAGGVAHDFNNMLTIVMNLGRLLEVGATDERQRGRAREIVETSERASVLTQQLLSIGRRTHLPNEVIDLGRVVREVSPLLRRTLRDDIELTVEAPASSHVRLSRTQVEQVLVNLALNARDAMRGGGKLALRLRESDGDAELTITDDGAGMTAETTDRIFEPFFTTKGRRGTGLGLSAVREIVTQSAGTIEVRSAPDAGTTFTIRWPITDAPPTTDPSRSPTVPPRGAGECVLVVDDLAEIREVLRTVLEDAGYRVATADSVASAMEEAERGPVDAVVTDVVMRGGSGAELIGKLRESEKPPALLMMTAYEDELPEELRQSVPLLRKPFVAEELLEAVRGALGARVS